MVGIFFGRHLAIEYLIYRTMADRDRVHHLSKVLHETVDYILERTSSTQDEAQRVFYIHALCAAAEDYGGAQLEVLTGLARGGSITPSRRLQCCHFNVFTYALAATAYLGLTELFQQLINEGTIDNLTYLGWALACAAGRGNFEIVRLMLDRGLVSSSSLYEAVGQAAFRGNEDIVQALFEYDPQMIFPQALRIHTSTSHFRRACKSLTIASTEEKLIRQR